MKSNFNDFVFLPNNENLSTYLIGGKKKDYELKFFGDRKNYTLSLFLSEELLYN